MSKRFSSYLRPPTSYLLLGLLTLVLSACSFTKLAYMNAALAYDNATPVLAWLVDDYVDMSGSQKGWVKARLRSAMDWHRRQELPAYRRFVEDLIQKSADGLSAAEAREAHATIRGFYHRSLTHLVPDIADFLLQLDDEQFARLERKFGDDNRKTVKESTKGSAERRLEGRVDKFLEHIEEFTGTLSGQQRQIVASYVKQMDDLLEERVGERKYRQAEVLALVRAKPPREKAIADLQRLLVDTDSWRRQDFKQKMQERDEKVFEMVGALSASLNAEQRAHVQQRLRSFLRDIGHLTAKVAPTTTASSDPAPAAD
jgi:hypothetical protein